MQEGAAFISFTLIDLGTGIILEVFQALRITQEINEILNMCVKIVASSLENCLRTRGVILSGPQALFGLRDENSFLTSFFQLFLFQTGLGYLIDLFLSSFFLL